MNRFYAGVSRKIIIFLFYFLIVLFFLFIPKILNFIKLSLVSDNTINIYAFMDIIPLDAIKEFEKQNGIKVRVKYFDNNEDLLAKFRINKGEGYDLITVTDYMIELLRRESLIQQINVAKIEEFKNIDSRLLNNYYDPGNKYSIPYAWSVYGIIYNKNYFGHKKIDWDYVFRRPKGLDYKICMLDDALESVFLTSIALFQKTRKLSESNLKTIENVLIEQKKWIECYTYSGSEYFLNSGTVQLALIPGLIAKKILKENNKFKFVIPSRGSLISIENFAVPIKSKKLDLIYKFISFMISKDAAKLNVDEFGYNPVNVKAYDLPEMKFMKNNGMFPPPYIFDKLDLVNNELSLERVNDIWLKVRVS
ncbi:MAG: spermidine/putrescine ABC transporter substrate-binding protein [bacterium]